MKKYRSTHTRSILCTSVLTLLVVFAGNQSALALARTWKSVGSDFGTLANWNVAVPVAGDVASFTTAETVQPILGGTSAYSITGFLFSGTSSSGYDVTRSSTGTFTLTGYNASTGSGGTSNSSAVAIRSEITSGTNTIEVPLTLAPALNSTSIFYQASGGTLVVKGAVSGSGITLSLKGGGTIELDADNSGVTGGMSIDQASTTVIIGDNNALGGSGGTGTFTTNNASTLQAGTAARSIANAVVLGADTTIGAGFDFTFNASGSVTGGSGAATRTLTVNNTNTTLAGSVFLSEASGTARTLKFAGSGAVAISGVISNYNGVGGTASNLSYSGTGSLTVSNAGNTYAGTTSVASGKLIVSGAINGSTVSVSPGSAVVATLASSGASNLIAPTNTSGNVVSIGSVTGGSTSRLAPGDVGTIGTMNFTLLGTAAMAFSANSELNFDLSSDGTSDLVKFNAAPAAGEWLSGANTAKLQLAGTIDYAHVYTVFQSAIANSTTGAFTFNSIVGYDTANYMAVFGPSGNDYRLSFVSIPEPSAGLALIFGTSVLIGARRRRRLA